MKARIGIYILCASVVVTSISSCKQAPGATQDATPVTMQTVVVHPKQTTDFLDIPARVVSNPSHLVHVYPPLSGRILGLRVLPGQEVRKGQQIAMLQSGDVAQARSDFERAKIEVLRADRALERGKLMLQHEVLSQADYYDLEATDNADHSELERTRQRIHELGFSENGTTDEAAIVAPISGAVLDVGTASGEMQKSLDNSVSIATIANLDSVWVVGDAFERDLSEVQNNRPVQVFFSAYPGLVVQGKIDNVSSAIDPATHTLKVRVVLANAGHKFKPDMFATIRVSGAPRSVIELPLTAVLHEGDSTSVFVKTPQGKYEERQVKVGKTSDKTVEVSSGLRDGETVVASNAALLRANDGANE